MSNPQTTKFGPDILTSDHMRNCQGREYQCSCGYDDAKDAEIARLRKIEDAARVPQIAPGHTDLMVSPASLDAWLEANPPPDEMINRNAVLEQAARECLFQMPEPGGDFEEGYRMACEENARNIRALKDETP